MNTNKNIKIESGEDKIDFRKEILALGSDLLMLVKRNRKDAVNTEKYVEEMLDRVKVLKMSDANLATIFFAFEQYKRDIMEHNPYLSCAENLNSYYNKGVNNTIILNKVIDNQKE